MAFPARLISLIAVLIAATFAHTALAADSTAANQERLALDSDGEAHIVRSIDDPDNPYSGHYGPWDIWVWENYQPDFNMRDYRGNHYGGALHYTRIQDGTEMPDGWCIDAMVVDAAGFPIPATVKHVSDLQFAEGTTVRELIEYPRKPKPGILRLYGAGIQPAGMKTDELTACYVAGAAVYPKIPAWLGENLPLKLVFLPGNEFAVYGELGLHYQEFPKGHSTIDYGQNKPETWYRYSRAGELLGTYKAATSWQPNQWKHLCCPEIDELIGQAKEALQAEADVTTFSNSDNGYYGLAVAPRIPGEQSHTSMFTQPWELKLAWDLFGTPVELDAVADIRFDFYSGQYHRETIDIIYTAQVEQGITDPQAVSPFAGLENGPQVVDPEPRFPPLFAQADNNWEETVPLVPLDDPKNPYRGQYKEWDIWMLENIGAMNPKEFEYDQEQSRLMQERIEARTAAGEEITQEDRSIPAFKPDPEDPWQQYIIHVDDSGCIVPALVYEQLSSKRWNYDLREDLPPAPTRFMMISEGIMPEDMLEELKIAKYDHLAIPEWLASAPVHRVVFIPNGDVVTLGPLGHRTDITAGLKRDELWQATERAWYRYNEQGNLISTYATQDNDWQVLYYPQWNELKANSEDQGLKVYTPAGYLVIDDPATGESKAVFDFDGTPVDPAALLVRPGNYCRALRWNSIERHLQMQELISQRSGESTK